MSKHFEMLTSTWSLPLTTTHYCNSPGECSSYLLTFKTCCGLIKQTMKKSTCLTRQLWRKLWWPMQITIVNWRLCITLSHKQYVWHISCKQATCVKKIRDYDVIQRSLVLTLSHGKYSTFLSLHKNIISHLIRFFHILLANSEPCNFLTVGAFTAITDV